MFFTFVLPWIAGGLVAIYLLTTANQDIATKISWKVPALASCAFLLWSLVAVVLEGPFGFWPVHIGSLWNNQVWFDLLLAVSIGWTAMLPAARSLGMRLLPWAIITLLTGCIGLTAMAARLLWLREKHPQGQPT